MDAKDTWPVVKFIMAATELKAQDARQFLEEIPSEKYAMLYLLCRKWDREANQRALEIMTQELGHEIQSETLRIAVERSKTPSHKQATHSNNKKGKKKKE